jgi:nitrate/nitrite-specific signal transduction histidine kinase
MSTNDKEHGGYVGKVREETQSYVRNLLTENHELRGLVEEMRAEGARLREELRIRDEQKAELDRKLGEIRSAGEQYLAQYLQLEQHNTNLANLYVASYQLHGTLDRQAVLTAMQEIVVNLVGSEEFAIVERNDDGLFQAVAVVGIDDVDDLHGREERIAQSTATGNLWTRSDGVESELTACIPLKLDGRVTGYIAIYRLLAHKAALEPLDHELFDLLATHAATALYCTSLSERIRAVAEGLTA